MYGEYSDSNFPELKPASEHTGHTCCLGICIKRQRDISNNVQARLISQLSTPFVVQRNVYWKNCNWTEIIIIS